MADQNPTQQPKSQEAKAKQVSIVRLVETNLDGSQPLRKEIQKIKGIGHMTAHAILHVTGFEGKTLGDLSESEVKTLEETILNVNKSGIPQWMFNRRREPTTNEMKHLVVSTLDFTKKMDINELKKIRCYRGVRHSFNLPVRGQRTRGSFRKGSTVGVSKKKGK